MSHAPAAAQESIPHEKRRRIAEHEAELEERDRSYADLAAMHLRKKLEWKREKAAMERDFCARLTHAESAQAKVESLEHKIARLESELTKYRARMHELLEEVGGRSYFVKLLDGRSHQILMPLSATAFDIATEMVYLGAAPSVLDTRFVHAGKPLEYDRKLYSYGLEVDTTIHLCLRLRGD